MTSTLRTSIIIPVKNGANYVEEALLSVLNNIKHHDEIIVIDDGSTDDTAQIIKTTLAFFPNKKILKESGLGPAQARNMGLEIAKGQFITFIDHDDLWPPSRLARHLTIFDQTPTADVVVGKTQYFSSVESNLNQYRFRENDNALHHVHLGASTFRRHVFDTVGLFNNNLKYSEDHDIFLRIRENNLILNFDEPISLKYRIHGNNMTLNIASKDLGLLKILYESIQRRRSNAAQIAQPIPSGA